MIPPLHEWPADPAEAVELQTRLAGQIDVSRPLGPVETVAGCDVAYAVDSADLFAAVVVVRAADGSEVERSVVRASATFPYVPGLLSFRECPALLAAIARLRTTPDAFMVDGQGIAHPRRFGLACHLGLWLEAPTIGCAKTWLVGGYDEPGPAAGGSAPLTIDGEAVGSVVRSATGAKPVFVSPGHRIDVPGATALVTAVLSGYRHPRPTRAAHLAANAARAGG